MFVSARVFWTIYYKDRTEQGSSNYFKNPSDLKTELNLLRLWRKQKECCMNVDVTFYPDSIFKETVTIMGAI